MCAQSKEQTENRDKILNNLKPYIIPNQTTQ